MKILQSVFNSPIHYYTLRFILVTELLDYFTRDILKIDLKRNENLNSCASWIDSGYSAEKLGKDLMAAKKIIAKQNLEFCMECRAFLAGVVQKRLSNWLNERSRKQRHEIVQGL